jgi:hypothetical protein
MNAKRLLKLVDRFNDLVGEAVAEGEPLPMIDGVFPPEVRKHVARRYPPQVGDLLDELQERRDAAQEAIDDLDTTCAMIECVARLLDRAEVLQQLQGDLEGGDTLPPLLPEFLPDDTPAETASEHDDVGDDEATEAADAPATPDTPAELPHG